MEDTRLPMCVMFGELVGGVGCVGGAVIIVDGMSPGRPQSFRYQHRPVGDCSPRRVGLTQDRETSGAWSVSWRNGSLQKESQG